MEKSLHFARKKLQNVMIIAKNVISLSSEMMRKCIMDCFRK